MKKEKKIMIHIMIFILFIIIFTSLYMKICNYTLLESLYYSVSTQTFTGATLTDKKCQTICTIHMCMAYILVTIFLYIELS